MVPWNRRISRLTSFVEASNRLSLACLARVKFAADQSVGHLKHGIRETGLLVDQQRHQRGVPPVELHGRSNVRRR